MKYAAILFGILCVYISNPLLAWHWTTDFTTNPSPVLLSGDAAYVTKHNSRCCKLTNATTGSTSWFLVNQPNVSTAREEWIDMHCTQTICDTLGNAGRASVSIMDYKQAPICKMLLRERNIQSKA